jgi:hypothetical protein
MGIPNQTTRRLRLTAAAAATALASHALAAEFTIRQGSINPLTGNYAGTQDTSVYVNLSNGGALLTNNYGAATTLFARAGSTRWRSILSFDLSALQGLGVSVTDASLTLYKQSGANAADAGTYTYSLYAIAPTNAGWAEGTRNGATALPGEVNGIWFAAPDADGDPAGIPWRNADGADVSHAADAASSLIATGPSVEMGRQAPATPYTMTGPALTTSVQSWIDSPSTNAGVFLSPAGPSIVINFHSSESTASLRPPLNLTLSSPTVSTTFSPTADAPWSEPANWSAGTPNSVGATANFPAAPAPRTVTVDANQIVSAITLDGPQPYTLAGPGTLRLLEVNAGQASIAVTSGSHTIAAPLNLSSPTAVDVAASSTLSLTGTLTAVSTLTKTGPGTLALSPAAFPSLLDALGITDLQAGALLLDYTAIPSPLAELRATLAAGRVRTTITPDTHSIGYADDGASSITLIATVKGDANLDGTVDADDLALTDRGFANAGTVWTQGDFNYDGIINEADYLIIDTSYLAAHPASPTFLAARDAQFGSDYVASLLTAVPEPTTLTLLAAALPFLSPRRRRR